MEQDKEVPESVSEEETVAEAVAEVEEQVDSEEEAVEHSAEKLHLLLEDARAKADEHWEMVIRARAESENLKKRHSRELENAHKFAIEKFVNELLPVRDSMELGLTAAQDEGADVAKLVEGTELTLKLLTDVMGKFDIEEINPVGEPFNPEFHQAMAMQPSSDVEPNTVLTVV
ncbi:MAG: nucleotide exchange factor GrpE, partial [Gammaproteobacteria bacterium]|nr:nucleotide exchange factor GrpE [Gammaproteobacteria bacterium]